MDQIKWSKIRQTVEHRGTMAAIAQVPNGLTSGDRERFAFKEMVLIKFVGLLLRPKEKVRLDPLDVT